MYTKFQRDNVLRLAIEVAQNAASRVGVESEIRNSVNGDIILTFRNPKDEKA
jgi:hypothetical protein